MTTMFYQVLSLGKLFTALEEAAINAHDAWVSQKSISYQLLCADTEARVKRELRTRGNEALQRYMQLFMHKHPRVRLTAAIAVQEYSPKLVSIVLDELRTGRYGPAIALPAELHYNSLRLRHLLPPL